jgi:hypothetical protein
MKKVIITLLSVITAVMIYCMIIYGVELSYDLAYKLKPANHSVAFSITLWIFYKYILPFVLLFPNMMLVFVKNKTVNRIAVFAVYFIFIFLWLGSLFSSFPYRNIPVFCVVTGFYVLDILAVKFIVKKIKSP